MLLEDQVELLRENLIPIQQQNFALPLMGGLSATKHTYRFKSLIHPARDIATTIDQSDPGGNKLPAHLRGWNLDATDDFRMTQKIPLKKLLGMIIHAYYILIGHGKLDVSNDQGKRIIVPYSVFLSSVQRLLLAPEDRCLVICSLTEEKAKNPIKMQLELAQYTPGLGDLEHCLKTITRWPPLQESIWETFFADNSKPLRSDKQSTYNLPFVKSWQSLETTVMWHLGWHRGNIYAESWIDVLRLAAKIRDHFSPAG